MNNHSICIKQLPFFLLLFLFSTLTAIPFLQLISIYPPLDGSLKLISHVFPLIFFIFLYAQVFWKPKHEFFKPVYGFSSPMKIPSYLLIFLGGFLLSESLFNLIPYDKIPWIPTMEESFEPFFRMIEEDKIVSGLIICFVGPVFEEIIFRGMLLHGLKNKGYSLILSVSFSAFSFAIIHFNVYQFLPALILGWILGWISFKENSLLVNTIFHVLSNSFSFFWYLQLGDLSISEYFGVSEIFILFLGIGIIVLGTIQNILTKINV